MKSSDPRPAEGWGTPAPIDLRILATTDLHAHVLPYDYYRDAPAGNLGLARAAGLIAAARTGAANSLLFDNGDFLQGSPLGDLIAAEGLAPGDIHPMIAAMNATGYDAVTLGNHEFNHGLDLLESACRGAGFPIVLANAVRRRGATALADTPFLPPYVLLDREVTDRAGGRHHLRIGVLGLVTPQIAIWDRDLLDGAIETRDSVETARAWVPRLRGEGADLVILLSHFGVGAPEWSEGMEDAAIPVARLSGADVQILGHSHLRFPSADFDRAPGVDPHAGLIGGVPSVMAGAFGAHLGQIDLTLGHDRDGFRVVSSRSRVLAADPLAAPHPGEGRVAATVAAAHARTLDLIRQPVGVATHPIDSFFALVAPDASLTLVADAQRDYVAGALAGSPYADLPVLSAVSPFKAGGRGGAANFTDIPAGRLALRHIADLYSFPNSIRALCLSGAEVAEWLERAASVYRRIPPGAQDAALIDPDMPSYNFDVVHGLDYTIDLSQPARYSAHGRLADVSARRVSPMLWRGRPVAPGQRFILATNSYRSSGGGDFPGLERAEEVLRRPLLTRDLLTAHVLRTSPLRPRRERVWRFCPMPGTTALFESSPAAMAALTGPLPPDGTAIEPAGPAPNGFHWFRLRL